MGKKAKEADTTVVDTNEQLQLTPGNAEVKSIATVEKQPLMNAGDDSQTGNWITIALQQNMDPDKLTKLFDLHERAERNAAVRAYNEAMRTAQAQIRPVVADSHNKQTKSNYPSLEALKKAIKEPCAANGLCVSFNEGDTAKPNHCRTLADVRHTGGHVEHFYLDLPLDGVGIQGKANMTAIHGRLSSDTYAQSRLIVKIFNIAITGDDTDNDGNATTVISPEQIEQLNTLIEQVREFLPMDVTKFCAIYEAADLGEIQAEKFDAAVTELKNRLKQGPTVKKVIDELDEWFSTNKPTVAQCNMYLTERLAQMEAGVVKAAVWHWVQNRTSQAGYEYINGKFQQKAKK